MMKGICFLLLVLVQVFWFEAFAQTNGGVSIGKGDAPAHSKAILELVSGNKGLLIPRLSTEQRLNMFGDADASARGLLVFDNQKETFYFWNGNNWKIVGEDLVKTGTKVPSGLIAEGQLFYNSTTDQLMIYSGESWIRVGNSSTTANGELILGDGKIYVGAGGKATETAMSAIPLSNFGAATGNISIGNNRIVQVQSPVNDTDAATKKYVDEVASSSRPNLSLDASQNLSISGGNQISLADLYQSLSFSGTTLSISGPRNSQVDLASLKTYAQTGTDNPQNAKIGDVFYNTSNDRFYVYDGIRWVEISIGGSTPNGPANPLSAKVGDVFYNTIEKLFYVYDGTKWAGISNSVLHDQTLSGTGTQADPLSVASNAIGAANLKGSSGALTNGTAGYVLKSNGDGTFSWYDISSGVAADPSSLNLAEGRFFIGDATGKASATAKTAIPLSGFGAATADVNFGGKKVTNVASPTVDSDAATKKYVDDKLVAGGSGDMGKATYDPAGIAQQVVGVTAPQTLTNKTLINPVITAPTGITKSDVGLSNVDNTSDLNKPISTAAQAALDTKVDKNAAITGATKTKITYDSKGLVTAGADATTADIAPSTDRNYVTNAQLNLLQNTSGVNTGDQTLNFTGNTLSISGVTGNSVTGIGDITEVVAGTGLSGGGNAGSVTLQLASGAVEASNLKGSSGALATTGTNGRVLQSNGDGTFSWFDISTGVAADPSSLNLGEGQFFIGDATGKASATTKNAIPLSGFGAATADVNLGGQKILNVASPGLDSDAATKKYVDDNIEAIPVATSTDAGLLSPADKAKLDAITGTNTGDETTTTILNKLGATAVTGNNTGDQTLSLTGTNLTISGTGGNVVDLSAIAGAGTIKGVAGENYLSVNGENIQAGAIDLSGTHATGILNAARFPALTGDVTTTAGSLATTLKTVGTAGTYRSVTTDAQGRVTAGTNPTTVAEYGITDVLSLSNTSPFTPDADYEPATKKYVDDQITSAGGGDMMKTTYDAAGIAEQLVGETATQTLTNKTLTSPVITSPTGITKSDVGLSNVDNTSDLNKPVSTATQTALDTKVDKNTAIVGATKTKITYDGKGLVTAGADATTADIAPSNDRNYVTDAQLNVLQNTSGNNTGDQTISLTGEVIGSGTSSFAATIANGAVTSDKIANDAITSAKIANGTITAADLSQMSATAGQVLQWNGAAWVPSTVTAGGDADSDPLNEIELPDYAAAGNEGKVLAVKADRSDVEWIDQNPGTVTGVAVTGNNGITATVLNAQTNPQINLGLGDLTPASVTATGSVTGSNLSGNNTGDQDLTPYALKANVLELTNSSSFIPSSDYHPATKKYVDDNVGSLASIADKTLLGNNSGATAAPTALDATAVKSILDLSLVENKALSSWAGSSSLTTLGTITSGIWNGTAIPIAYGGTGANNAATAINALLPAKAGAGKVLATNASNNGVEWVEAASTSLPVASATDLGGIKVGANLSINADGILTADVASYHNHTLDQLANVSITSKATNDLLQWDASSLKWVNRTIANAIPAVNGSGSGLMTVADKTKLDGIATGANNYVLPKASTTELGGVMVGTGLTISNGVLSTTGGSGTVTEVSVIGNNGISGSIANSTTTPEITLSLGDITPASVSSGAISATTITASGTITGNIDMSNLTGAPLSPMQGGTGLTSLDGLKSALNLENVDNTRDAAKPISNLVQIELNKKLNADEKGASGGVVPLGVDGKIDAAYLPASITGDVAFKGAYDVSDPLPPVAASAGDYYITSVAGTTPGNELTLEVGDWILSDGSTWSKITRGSDVSSFNGRFGAVVPVANDYNTDMVPQGTTNLYYTDGKVDTRINSTWKSTNVAGNTELKFPTEKAVKSYVDAKVPDFSITTANKVLTINASGVSTWADPVGASVTLTGAVTGTGTSTLNTTLANNIVTSEKIANGTIQGVDVANSTIGALNLSGITTIAGTQGMALTSDGAGGFVFQGGSETDLSYSPAAASGTIVSSSGDDATIPGATSSNAGLMIATDKTKLNKIADLTGATDANKVLTANADGTAAVWKAPAAGGSSLQVYHPNDDPKVFCRATGPGVTFAMTTSNTYTITIPNGVHVDYFKFWSSYATVGSQNFLNIIIKDESGMVNNSLADAVYPAIYMFDIIMTSPILHQGLFPGTSMLAFNAVSISSGAIQMQTNSLSSHKGSDGFYISIRP